MVAPGSDFSWFRSRVLGGRTNHYGRVTLRMADYDFKPKTTDGLGWDWPISYEDLAPYYDKAEQFIGVTGTREGIRSAPDGIFNPPGALKAHETLVQRACATLNIRAVHSRQAVTTVARNGRPPCPNRGKQTPPSGKWALPGPRWRCPETVRRGPRGCPDGAFSGWNGPFESVV